MVMIVVVLVTVAEPDLHMKGGGGGGGGHPDPEIRRAVSKKIISAFRASVWSKDKGGGGGQAPMAPPLDPSLGDDNNVLAPKPFLISSIDYNPSVIWISPKNGTCP